jgi:hypothetical protein
VIEAKAMTLDDPFLKAPLPPFQAFGIDLPQSQIRPGPLGMVAAVLAILCLLPVVLVIRAISLGCELKALLCRSSPRGKGRLRPMRVRSRLRG